MKNIKRIALWILTGSLLLTLVACNSNSRDKKAKKEVKEDTWSQIEKKKEVVIGIDDSFVPMGYLDKKDQLVGFDIDLAKKVFAKYGIKPKFQNIDWSMKENELKNGSIDLIWNGYTITPARQKQLAFSKAYMKNAQVIVSMKKDNIKKAADMQDKVLGVQNGSSGMDSLNRYPEKLLDNVKNGEAELYDTFNEGFIDLKSGRIQGLLIDEVYADYYLGQLKDSKDYQVTESGFTGEKFAIGIRKSDKQLQDKINQALAELSKDGSLKNLSEKWFKKDITYQITK